MPRVSFAVGSPVVHKVERWDLHNGKSAYQEHQETLQRVMADEGGLGVYVVRGYPPKDNFNEEDYEDIWDDVDNNVTQQVALDSFSAKSIKKFRGIIITRDRNEAMAEMQRLVLAEKYSDSLLHFDEDFADHVVSCYDFVFKPKYEYSNLKRKFDLLLGFTDVILSFNSWMFEHDVEWVGSDLVSGLAEQWQELLQQSPEDIGIDSQFTLSAVLYLLRKFKRTIKEKLTA